MSALSIPHPAARLMSWIVLVTAVQGLAGTPLGMALGGAMVLALWQARGHLVRLIKRARVLLLTITLLFACGTPGESLWPWLGSLSPTSEGIGLAAEHGGRLILVLAFLALLFQMTPPAELVAGIHGLLAPFAALGAPREKVALRLLLVLQYAEAQKGEGRLASWKQWLDWLECHDDSASAVAPLRIPVAPWRWTDLLLVALSLLGASAVLIWGS